MSCWLTRVRTHAVVIDAPSIEDGACLGQRAKQRLIQGFITQSIDEALNKCILLRHSVQPVAIPTIVQVWMNEPLTEIPPRARRSAS